MDRTWLDCSDYDLVGHPGHAHGFHSNKEPVLPDPVPARSGRGWILSRHNRLLKSLVSLSGSRQGSRVSDDRDFRVEYDRLSFVWLAFETKLDGSGGVGGGVYFLGGASNHSRNRHVFFSHLLASTGKVVTHR